MLSHRLSGFTGPVPSAALDKSVFSCFLRNILSSLRRNVKNSLTLFIQHSKIDQEDRFDQQKHSVRCAFAEKKSVTLCLFAVQQLDRAGSAQTVRAQREELFHIVHGGDAAGSLDLAAAMHTLTISSTSWKVAPAVEKPVLVLI